MFNNLIESGSHERDLKRKGTFFIGTFLFYTVLLTGAGIGSIYAYNVRLDAQNDYELLTIMRFPPAQAKDKPVERRVPEKPAASRGGSRQVAVIKHLVVNRPLPDRPVAPETARILPPGTIFTFGEKEFIPPADAGISGADKGIGVGGDPKGSNLPVVSDPVEAAPPIKIIPKPTPEPPQRPTKPVSVPSSILSGKAIHKPAPPYPIIAKQIRQQGAVAVQIVVDEQGRVVSAKATSGPPLLLQAAEKAAYQARFTPTTLNGQPVKISGIITYNFILQ